MFANTLKKLIENVDQVFDDPAAESILLDFYKLKREVEEAEKQIKKKLEEAALKHSPDFKSLACEKLSIRYQYMGSKYTIDEEKLSQIPHNLYKVQTRTLPDSKSIDEFVKYSGELPTGISENKREKKILIAIKKDATEEPVAPEI